MSGMLLIILCIALLLISLPLLTKPKTRSLGYAALAFTAFFISVAIGYTIGKNAAQRDNARQISSGLGGP